MNAPTRYCHPCKANGVKTPAYQTNTGLNGRARVEGKIVNVCDMHRDALTVVRAEIAGQGHESRQAWEANIFDATMAEDAAARKDALVADRDMAVSYLTQTHLTGLHRAASRERNALLADALYDTYFDEAVKRIGNAIFNGENLTPAYVDTIVWTATKSNSSERKRMQDARLDMPVGENGDTLQSIVGERPADTDPITWRVGGMNVTREDLASLLAGAKRPADITLAEWAELMMNYAA